jgi:hypothetical protein
MLDNGSAYEALSYTWTTDLDSTTAADYVIQFNEVEVAAKPNLYMALQRARLKATSRMLWADAIRINQEDVHEQSTQVAAMGSISGIHTASSSGLALTRIRTGSPRQRTAWERPHARFPPLARLSQHGLLERDMSRQPDRPAYMSTPSISDTYRQARSSFQAKTWSGPKSCGSIGKSGFPNSGLSRRLLWHGGPRSSGALARSPGVGRSRRHHRLHELERYLPGPVRSVG